MLVGEERFRFNAFAAMLLLFGSVSAILMGLSELSRFASPGMPLVGYSLCFSFVMYIIITYITANDRKIVRFMATGGGEMFLAMLVVSVIASTILFGLVCREIQFYLGSGFSGNLAPRPWLWVGFGFDNLFEAVFLDIPNIYRLSMTNIQADNIWTQSLVLMFRSAANLVIIRAALRYWGFLRNFLFAERLARGG